MGPRVGYAARGAGSDRVTPPHYVDAAAFTALFRHRHKNHAAICSTLARIVDGVASQIWFCSSDERREIKQDALLIAIERIDRFDRSRGRNAFSYYTKLVFHSIVRKIGREKIRRSRAMHFADVDRNCRWFNHGVENAQVLEEARPYARAS